MQPFTIVLLLCWLYIVGIGISLTVVKNPLESVFWPVLLIKSLLKVLIKLLKTLFKILTTF